MCFGALNVTVCENVRERPTAENLGDVERHPQRVAACEQALTGPFSETFTTFDWPASSVSPRAEPTVTTTLRIFGFLRAVTAISLRPRNFSVTVIRNVSLQVAPAAPVHDTRTNAAVPLTLAWPTDVWPLPGGGDAVVNF